MTITNDAQLAPLTTFGISAKAKILATYSSVDELERLSRSPIFLENEVLHIGGGSNLLFIGDYNGLVAQSQIKGIVEYPHRDQQLAYLIAGAGEKWSDLVEYAITHNLAGLENLAGIPGTAGASAVQNVGAYGVEAGDTIFAVEVFDTTTRTSGRLSAEECRFGYRDSIFKHEGKGKYVVTRVCFLLRKSSDAKCLDYGPLRDLEKRLGHAPSIREVADEVVKIRNAKLPDPAILGSAGSFFKNPVIHKGYFDDMVAPLAEGIPTFKVSDGMVKLPAAWLIDKAGLKGAREGDAEVYPGQPLVIVNRGNATGKDVAKLAQRIVRTVHEKFNVILKPEVNFIDSSIEITVLGSGTSKGVPEVACSCRVCRSADPRDKRFRASVLVRTHGMTLLIDPSPDFRLQALRENLTGIDAVLVTHSHYDHVGGIDDLRPFCMDGKVKIYLRKDVDDDLRRRIDYCFREHPYPGVPAFDTHIIDNNPFFIEGLKIIPVDVEHGKLPIYGYRIGDFAYITDAKTISPEEKMKLRGLKVLIINALRKKEHFAHLSLSEALELIGELKPQRAYLTHFNHEIGLHSELCDELPDNVFPAFDGLTIHC